MTKHKALLIIVFSLSLLCACTAKQPDDIADKYWRAVMAGDLETLETIVTENSLTFVETVRTPDKGSKFELGELHQISDDRIEIDTAVTIVQDGNSTTNHIKTILEKENDAWKVNLPQTRRGLYASLLQNSFSDIGESLQDGAAALKELSKQLSTEVSQEISAAADELKQQTQQANEAIQETLDEIQKELNR